MTVGKGKPATHLRIKLLNEKYMEALNLGITYTAFSRCESDSNWCLVEKLPQDRLLYINEHPNMKQRHEEEKRLKQLSEQTLIKYGKFIDVQQYVNLLRQLDQFCNDGIIDSRCAAPNSSCCCILCS